MDSILAVEGDPDRGAAPLMLLQNLEPRTGTRTMYGVYRVTRSGEHYVSNRHIMKVI